MTSRIELPEIASIGEPPLVEDLDSEVDAFLQHHLFLLPVLRDAVRPLSEIFGKDTRINVYVEAGDSENDGEYLVIAVQTTLPVDDADQLLETFDTTWWLANLPSAKDKLLFTLEFV